MRQPFDPDMLTPFERALMRIDDPAVPKPSADDLMALLDEPSSENRDWNRLSRIMADPHAVEALRATLEAQALAKELGVQTKPQLHIAPHRNEMQAAAAPPVFDLAAAYEPIPAKRPFPLLWVTVGSLAVAASVLTLVFLNRTPTTETNLAGRSPTNIESLDDSSKDLEQFVAQGSWKLRDLESVGEINTNSGEGWLSEPSLANEAIYRDQEFKWSNSSAQFELWDVTKSGAVETEQTSGTAKPKSSLTPNHIYEVRMKDSTGTRIARFRALGDSEERLIEQAKSGKGSVDTCAKVLVIAGRYEDARTFLETHADQLGERTKGIVRAAYLKRGEMTGQKR